MAVARRLLRGVKAGGGGVSGPPAGLIAMWSGTLATIPANWALCDGTGGTPNLVARFIVGSAAGVDPGATAGADSHGHAEANAAGTHTHTAQLRTHTHIVVSAGSHNHGAANLQDSPQQTSPMAGSDAGAHTHTTNADAGHTHTMSNDANHYLAHNINNADGRPPYYEVAFIQAQAGALFAIGIVAIWSGTLITIPVDWSLCDGGGSRPDLRSRFSRGINTAITNPGTTGGAATHLHIIDTAGLHNHDEDVSVAHTHTFNLDTVAHNHGSTNSRSGTTVRAISTNYNWTHQHAVSDSIGIHDHDPLGNDGSHTHTVNPASSLPAYQDIAFIYHNNLVAPPTGAIFIWTGLLANIPVGYSLCDGAGGRPDLRDKFVRGSNAGVDPGGTGGSNTHSHTDVANADHNSHSQTNAGAHQHAATDTIGNHTHTTSASFTTFNTAGVSSNTSAGNHSHTYNNEDNHTHVLTASGTHIHVWDGGGVIDGRPAYYEVAFIYKN